MERRQGRAHSGAFSERAPRGPPQGESESVPEAAPGSLRRRALLRTRLYRRLSRRRLTPCQRRERRRPPKAPWRRAGTAVGNLGILCVLEHIS